MSDEFGWRPRSVVHCASSIGVLVIAMCIGCNRNDDARKMELRSTDTIKLTMDSDYYTSVPPRDRPPDGTFPAGTVVSVMVHQDNKWAGGFFRGQEGVRGFFLVQTMDGFQAYVDFDGILDAEDVASPPDSDNAAEQSEGRKTSSDPKSGRLDSVGSQSSAS